MGKTIINIDPFTGSKIEVTAMGKDIHSDILEGIYKTELPGKLIASCIKHYCTVKFNGNQIITKDMLYSKNNTIITGDNVYIDKTCKAIPVATQYNICLTAMANFDGNKAKIVEYNEINDTIKVGIQMADGSARIATLNDAATIIKEFA